MDKLLSQLRTLDADLARFSDADLLAFLDRLARATEQDGDDRGAENDREEVDTRVQ